MARSLADVLAVLVALAAPAVVHAGPGAAAGPRELDYVIVEPSPARATFAAAPDLIYLDRCAGGCTITAGSDDAHRGTSSILGRNGVPSTVTLEPFRWPDEVWNDVVACVRATYAPYDVEVVTSRPAAGPYVRVVLGGDALDLNIAGNTLGIAPLTSDCSAQDSAIAFTFANSHQQGTGLALDICATAAHEAGHVYGLDHEFECKDPMTYLVGCGQKVFLNKTVACGEFEAPRPCKCGETQSSFRKLTDVLGAGPRPPGPALELISPVDGGTVTPAFSVFLRATGRPLAVAELWVNGAEVASVPGKSTDAPYELRTPRDLPDGVQRLEVRAYDDLGGLSVLAATVSKGEPCAGGGCPDGATCQEGACVHPAGTGVTGDACERDEQCASRLCAVRGDDRLCSDTCWPSGASCGGDLSCQHADDERLVCLPPPPDEGGCCSSGRKPTGPLALALVVLALLRPRRSTSLPPRPGR